MTATLYDKTVSLLPTRVYGPLILNGNPIGALLLGRSSSVLKGLFVVPGIIDADYMGEIKIMAKTDFPPLHIPKGTRIAQLVPLQQLLSGAQQPVRGTGGFGSTGDLALFSLSMATRPEILVRLTWTDHSITLTALLDSGADITIVSLDKWPPTWPLKETFSKVEGVGGSQAVRQSPLIQLQLQDDTISTTVTVMPLPAGVSMLISRDVLSQLGARLTSDRNF